MRYTLTTPAPVPRPAGGVDDGERRRDTWPWAAKAGRSYDIGRLLAPPDQATGEAAGDRHGDGPGASTYKG